MSKASLRRLRTHGTRRQRGAVLVVGLIILVVLTLLGVQAMRTNVAQERMAGNMRDRYTAFQAAESVLRVGESTGPFDKERTELLDATGWDGSSPTGVLANFDSLLAADPVFHVGPPQPIRIGLELPPKYRYIYPVTGRSVGGRDTSSVILQSGFEPLY
ncbi:MAG: PilX N-terminal domain-containing pilus assembly protein [Pseudomonadota bacterium]